MDEGFIKRTNSCAGLAPADCEALWQAAQKAIGARGPVMRIVETLGSGVTSLAGRGAGMLKEKFGVDVPAKIQDITQDLLWKFQSGAMTGLEPDGKGDRWEWFHKTVGLASGATAGFVGLPGLMWDLPITTTMIMRSVADIARAFPDEDIDSDDTRRACLEVFAAGSPTEEDDEADLGYWTTRLGLSHATVEMAIRTVAARFGVVISQKMLAQSIPVAGALAGAGLNYAFIDYYQEMARVQFMIRGVERRAPDPSSVRPCFAAIAREIRARRRPGVRPPG